MTNEFEFKTLSELIDSKHIRLHTFERMMVRYLCYHGHDYKKHQHIQFDLELFDIHEKYVFDRIDYILHVENILYVILCLNSLLKIYMLSTRIKDDCEFEYSRQFRTKEDISTFILNILDDIQRNQYLNCLMLRYTCLIVIATLCKHHNVQKYINNDIEVDMDMFTRSVLRYCENVSESEMLLIQGVHNIQKTYCKQML